MFLCIDKPTENAHFSPDIEPACSYVLINRKCPCVVQLSERFLETECCFFSVVVKFLLITHVPDVRFSQI